MRSPTIILRKATLEDVPVLRPLITDYTQLIRDGTYLLAEAATVIVGCGGWSRRKTAFGSDHVMDRDNTLLDPAKDAAKIRAFFVHPKWARQGNGSRILDACEAAAAAEGFARLELVSTLPGEPMYRARGFVAGESFEVPLPNGTKLPVVHMTKKIER
ncbi:MAG: GNAT family N-acetyltransferase [Terriglobales bacterium]